MTATLRDQGLSDPASPKAYTVTAAPHGANEIENEIGLLLPGTERSAEVTEGQLDPPAATSEKTIRDSALDPAATITVAGEGPPWASESGI